MPFTAAHPAAVLPLRRWCPHALVWSALVIGSLTPDLECFLALRPQATHGLTLAGSFYFCLPAGLVLYGAFHAVVKRPITLLLPAGWRRAAWPAASDRVRPGWSRAASIAASILVGAWLHQAWDAFTHAGHWGVATFPVLSVTLLDVGRYELTAFRALQHASTAGGLLCLAVAAFRWRARSPVREAPALREPFASASLCALAVACAVPAVLRGLEYASPHRGIEYARHFVGATTIAAVAFGSLALAVFGLTVTLFWKRLVRETSTARVAPVATPGPRKEVAR